MIKKAEGSKKSLTRAAKSLSPLALHLMGVQQALDSLFTDPVCRSILHLSSDSEDDIDTPSAHNADDEDIISWSELDM